MQQLCMLALCQSWNWLLCLLLSSDYILVTQLMALFTRRRWFIARLTFRPSWLLIWTLPSFLLNCEVQTQLRSCEFPCSLLWRTKVRERERFSTWLPLWLLFTALTADSCFIKWGELTDTVALRLIFWNVAHSEHIYPRQAEKCRHGDIKKCCLVEPKIYQELRNLATWGDALTAP